MVVVTMPPEPPVGYQRFVAQHLVAARAEAARLAGDDRYADEIYPDALSDVAGRWRLLMAERLLTHHDAPDRALSRALASRARRWHADRAAGVEVIDLTVSADPFGASPSDLSFKVLGPARTAPEPPRTASLALRKADVLPSTEVVEAVPLAEAAIAWEHAYKRYRWHRVSWEVGIALMVLIALAEWAQRIAP